MTNDNRLDQMESQIANMQLVVNALLETATLHQRNLEAIQHNFETVVSEMQTMRADIRQLQTNFSALQAENQRLRE